MVLDLKTKALPVSVCQSLNKMQYIAWHTCLFRDFHPCFSVKYISDSVCCSVLWC